MGDARHDRSLGKKYRSTSLRGRIRDVIVESTGAASRGRPSRSGPTPRRLEVMAGQVTGVIGRNGGEEHAAQAPVSITMPSEGRAEIPEVGSLLEVGTGFTSISRGERTSSSRERSSG
jgi:hypothetical protein